MSDNLHFTDKDLEDTIKEFAKKYFYDFSLIIHSAFFGRKGTSAFGWCVPLKGFVKDDIVMQNLEEVEKSKITNTDIEINSFLKECDCSETILHEMCHSVNFTMGDWDAGHGKEFKKVAEIVSKRSGYEINTNGTDERLDMVLGLEDMLRKAKKEPGTILYLWRTRLNKMFDKHEDLYAKAIDGLNKIHEGIGDLMADLIESGKDFKDNSVLDDCADKMDILMPKYKQLRMWNF